MCMIMIFNMLRASLIDSVPIKYTKAYFHFAALIILLLLLTMSALKCYKLQATTFLEIYNASFGPWATVLRLIHLTNLTAQKR